MSVIKEFKEFAMKGNVVDLAVGVVIGGAFGKITASIVNDIIMPPIGMVLGKVDFKELKVLLHKGSGDVADVTINYGAFISTIIDFTIVAFALFIVIKAMNKMKKKEEAKPVEKATLPADVEVLMEIRDLLKKK